MLYVKHGSVARRAAAVSKLIKTFMEMEFVQNIKYQRGPSVAILFSEENLTGERYCEILGAYVDSWHTRK